MHACSAWRGSFHEKDDHHNRADQRVRTKKNPAPTRSQTASAVVLSPGRLYVVKKVVILSNFSFRSLPGLRKHPVLYSCSSEPNPTVSGLIFLGSTIFFLSGWGTVLKSEEINLAVIFYLMLPSETMSSSWVSRTRNIDERTQLSLDESVKRSFQQPQTIQLLDVSPCSPMMALPPQPQGPSPAPHTLPESQTIIVSLYHCIT